MADAVPIKRALISVYDKTDVIPLANHLQQLGVEILATSGTAKYLQQHHINSLEISQYTNYPEIMDGRVKTLHPKIYGALLGRQDIDDQVMEQLAIPAIDLLIVNLYPFTQVVQAQTFTPSQTLDNINQAIDNIDIGGPCMIRAGAKNYQRVTVLIDSQDYPAVNTALRTNHGCINLELRTRLATKAFAYTSHYDAAISQYFSNVIANEIDKTTMTAASPQAQFPEIYSATFRKQQDLRYGENPHQLSAFYLASQPPAGCIATAQQLQGKPLSFNNLVDADTALECVKQFTDLTDQQAACVIVKHANPCGVAVADSQTKSYLQALATDPTSAFGGIIAFNQPLSQETAKTILAQQFVEIVIAPTIDDGALALLASKTNIRVMASGQWPLTPTSTSTHSSWELKTIGGGLLIQDSDHLITKKTDLTVVTVRQPTSSELNDLYFAWKVCKFVKSNAIVYAKNQCTLGIGAGQSSRIDSCRIAASKAKQFGFDLHNAVMASDAFLPFKDNIAEAANLRISAIIQPGGSLRDQEIIDAANQANIAMVFTGLRHFRH